MDYISAGWSEILKQEKDRGRLFRQPLSVMQFLPLYIWNKIDRQIPAFKINDIILDMVAFIKEKIEDTGECDIQGFGKIILKKVNDFHGYVFVLIPDKSVKDLYEAKKGRKKRLEQEGE